MGRIRTEGRWHMRRRQGGYSFPRAVAERLEGCLKGFGNRDACAELARLLALAHRRAGAPFVACREALAGIIGHTEDQVRGALKVLERIGFLDRVGGGEFDRERQKRRPVLWRLGWAAGNSGRPTRISAGPTRISAGPAGNSAGISGSANNSPTEGLRPKGNRSWGDRSPTRIAALAALERVRGEGAYAGKLSAAALAAGRWR